MSAGLVRWRPALWGGIAVLLLAPLLAMRFTDEMAWTAFDFAAAAVVLVGIGIAIELAGRTRDARRRSIAYVAIVGIALTVWAQGAVGIV